MDAYIDRHPATGTWDPEHAFNLCKLDIRSIIALDWYGGPHHVTVEDYFNHKYDNAVVEEGRPRRRHHRQHNNEEEEVRIHLGSGNNGNHNDDDVVIEV